MTAIVDVRVPDIGDYTEVPVVEIPVVVGDVVAKDDPLIVLESDKATLDVPSPAAGKIVELKVAVNDQVSEGVVIVSLETAESENTEEQVKPTPETAPPVSQVDATATLPPPIEAVDSSIDRVQSDSSTSMPAYATPSIRRFARQLGVNITDVTGTGPKNRIMREDVEAFVKAKMSESSAGSASFGNLPKWPQVDFASFGPIERQPLSRIGKISGPALARNAMVIPHVTHFDKTDVTELEDFRKLMNQEAKVDDAKITMLAFTVKACVSALKAFPEFNSSLDGDELVVKQYWNIGVAANTADGLVVPVIKEADAKGVREIASEMTALAAAARDQSLKASDMQGSTFTISSLGGIGGTNFTPIINAPEVAILGMPRSEIQPHWDGNAFQPRLIQPLGLSFDHRVVDGVAAARFLAHVGAMLNDFRRISA